jgi:hypothetical protein
LPSILAGTGVARVSRGWVGGPAATGAAGLVGSSAEVGIVITIPSTVVCATCIPSTIESWTISIVPSIGVILAGAWSRCTDRSGHRCTDRSGHRCTNRRSGGWSGRPSPSRAVGIPLGFHAIVLVGGELVHAAIISVIHKVGDGIGTAARACVSSGWTPVGGAGLGRSVGNLVATVTACYSNVKCKMKIVCEIGGWGSTTCSMPST